MKRSSLFITVLLSLFIFQSVWNVAAAFCIHEGVKSSVSVEHFGHHSDEQKHHQKNTSIGQNIDEVQSSKFIQYLEQMDQDDHSDHLPSFAHIVLNHTNIKVENFPQLNHLKVFNSDWKNFYRSPYLNFPDPPPVLSPL